MTERENHYKPVWFLRNPHLQTVFPTLSRHIFRVNYERERIDTPDGDFLDLDWLRSGARELVILCHGLEGSSRSNYILGMGRLLAQTGYDVLAMNYRGCSGTPNRLLPSYHSGKSDDLAWVVQFILNSSCYETVSLIGFSVGGNIVLKFLAEERDNLAK